MSILLPTALFSALDRDTATSSTATVVTDELRANFLYFSRGTAVILLVMYVSGLLSAPIQHSPRSQLHLLSNLPPRPPWRGQRSRTPPICPSCPQGRGTQACGGGTRNQFMGLPRCHYHYHRFHGRHCRVPCGEHRIRARGGNHHGGVRSAALT